jgi:hypothetical protein
MRVLGLGSARDPRGRPFESRGGSAGASGASGRVLNGLQEGARAHMYAKQAIVSSRIPSSGDGPQSTVSVVMPKKRPRVRK